MFDSILIANRGEIACRVIRTARCLGIRTVAVYSDADAGALHVAMADEARHIGPAPARDSYLRADRILDAARATGAQAIHPGYGFLSENDGFAEACTAAGITFIGPPAAAIRAMGTKSAAKALMERAGVPLVPGYHGDEQSPDLLHEQARRIGYPVLIKASAGGGGKGMRIVPDDAAFDEALSLAKGEARASFGDDHVLIERYLTKPRHIEVQVFADSHGNVVHLFERDCSIQRRHQKVIEEAPAPGMDPARRAAMGQAACDAARAIGYVGAGTVEFIAEGGEFFFMEMNTRLQVEHPVTEAVTGQDLVEWQLRVASGERLPLLQDDLTITGHAVEARIYAEDPARDFAPSTGRLIHLRTPPETDGIRVDTGVREGDAITVNYDPMIAKLIAYGSDRAAAIARLSRALAAYEVVGPSTNIALLRSIAEHPAFRAAALDTGFIAHHADDLMPAPGPVPRPVLAATVARLLLDQSAQRPTDPADRYSPWNATTAWRLNGGGYQDFHLRDRETTLVLRAHLSLDGAFRLDLPAGPVDVRATEAEDGRLLLRLDGATVTLRALRHGDAVTVFHPHGSHTVIVVDPLAPGGGDVAGAGRILAPMPGRVLDVLAKPGDAVTRGTVLLVLEAMKVQMRITAPADGTVAAVNARIGELVEDGAELVTLAPAA
ncbi:acetyl/propionyl/methylcrotonyl-CoA carboxylase subunit alpha [Roseomonas sp. CCTCC AB2023176]|uniref:acetyl/propionyl/methylcrotonyl-CoA carboxylase subunit alpha n=1 Tax=Roseomonas sp. CCTCC AB2023176 TaxID=3342640 RepID=UPI0035DC3B2E